MKKKMRRNLIVFTLLIAIVCSCTTTNKLAYLNDLHEATGDEYFFMDIPEYRIQIRDILHITVKMQTPDGSVKDFLSSSASTLGPNYAQGEAGQYLYGYDVGIDGSIAIPVLGSFEVMGKTLTDIRRMIQTKADSLMHNSLVECKLLSFKFTVLGEVRTPGTYINYNNYLTVIEAIGRAGGITDFGRRDRLLVLRPDGEGIKTYTLNLQHKGILASEAYFILPNDVIIVEVESKKVFNMNLPAYSFILTTVTSLLTTTLLLISYLGK